ncbi:hypothetical protein E5083_03640 [Streptomyces bauhiniae]|uniref:Uncharacterized protein n=1 Tax=Streptomyces bauhiniae TaxID=2340725 RepID=A0A4Z1DF20_9ACTN|nr:hypothetical protein E5083_03640 [Streptomyces bauhiniae]
MVVGGDVRVTGGLWRHGGNRPLPLHKVMDSGNKGYASKSGKVRSGPFIVVQVTSRTAFRAAKWRETSGVPDTGGTSRACGIGALSVLAPRIAPARA